MKNLFNIFTMLLVSLVLSSCASSGTNLLNSLSKTDDYKTISNISYGASAQNRLDVYQPNEQSASNNSANNKKPVLVFFYGGCWGQCSDFKKSSYQFVAQSFASRGFVTVIADFRQYPKANFEILMLDASKVMTWTSQNIAKFGGDKDRMIVAGHSSGAHIASMLALNSRYNKTPVRGFIGLAGPYDFLPLNEVYQRKLFSSENNYAGSQPINFITAQSPPLLLLHGKKDTTVFEHNAVNLSKKAQGLGVNQRLIFYPKLDHTSILVALSRPFQGRSTVLQDMLKFMKLQTK